MGVPKFFRYISERYPCLSDVVREHEIPEFDNLYLDMNGIIHVCSHPNDFDPHFRITEESIFTDIFHYIEILFRMIQPKRLFFMAVDGVAPRAKMNQQRGRRFRSAKDAEVLEAKATAAGEVLPDAERFDSNCITPGTTFMARLHAQLKYFVSYKISTDKLWQKPTVILSGHETPGEGEHKIMDYIRYLKSKPDYDPDTRHCLYGLDADLIMLGLCTHEPHFALLREEVKFGKNSKDKHFKRSSVPEEIKFYLLHLSLMREYIEIEFQDLKKTIQFPFDLESIIDDWVLMGFLVGNDFIPHLPNLHIASGALPLLYKAYIEVLPTLGGYINEGGSLNLPRFQKYMEKLGDFDISQFRDTYADLKYFQEKTGRRPNEKERTSYKNNGESNTEFDGQPPPTKNPDLAALIQSTDNMMAEMEGDEQEMYFSSDEEGNEDAIMFAEFYQHKNDYYINKLEYEKVTPEVLRSQAEGYVRAIQWNLNYYYNGCCSWSWFYPHHYAPFISDITNFKDLKLEFDGGEPFLPFQQLLAVLPAASKKLLPEPFQELMVNDDSPIISFYPTDFKTDMNGKKQEWEAVVLIPFINQDSLLKAMATKYDRLTDEEKRRNSHGPMLVYNYTPFKQGSYEAPEYFPTLNSNFAKETRVNREEILVDESRLVKGLCPGVRLEDYFPGFPSLRHLEFTATLKKAKVKVFDQPSRGENTILTLKENTNLSDDVLTVASIMLDKIVFVNYPQLIQAKVVAVADENKRVILRPSSDGSKAMVTEDMNSDLAQQWNLSKKSIVETHAQRLGIEIGNTKILVYASSLEGQKFIFSNTGKVSTEKQWTKIPSSFALQTIVRNIVYAEREMDQTLTIDDLFKPSTTCFSLGTPHYGAMGTVLEGGKNGRIKLSVVAMVEPDLEPAMEVSRRCRSSYVPGHIMAQRLGISSHLLSRITGSIFVVNNSDPSIENVQKTNIGLNLKFTKRNEEVCGYTRKDNNQWLYSPKAEQLINNYMRMVPDVIQHISTFVFNDVYNINEMFPENSSEQLKRLVTWLNEQDFMKAERLTCGSVVLEEEVVDVIEKIIDYTKNKTAKTVTMQIKPHLLLLPKTNITGLCPDGNAVHKVFDRIVCIRESYSVPLGLKGTIIGIQSAEKEDDVIYDIVFDKEFVGGIQLRCSNNRGYRMTRKGFLNLSYGLRLETNKNKSGAAVTDYERFIENNPWNNKRNSAFTVCNNSSTNNLNKNHNQPFRQQPQPLMQIPSMPPHQANAQPSQNPKQRMQSVENLFPKFSQSNTNNPSAGQSSPSKPTSEFQAMWNELKKAGTKPSNPVAQGQTQNNDPSDMLKKMLKIADASPKKKQLVPSKEDARVADKSSDNDTNNVVLLEDYLKERDKDKPVYTYSYDIVRGNTLITAKLYFEGESDEENTFVGSQSADIQSAAESAALNALNYLKLNSSLSVGLKPRNVSAGSHGKPQPSAQPSSNIYVPPNRMQMPMPFNNSRQQQNSFQQHQQFRGRNNSNNDNTFNWFNPELPTPPQQWYQQNYSDSRHMDWKLRPDFPSHQMPVPPFHNHPQHLQPNNHFGRSNSKPPGSTTNWRQVRPIVPMVPSQNPFVPLQAITQCRTRPSTCSNFISKNTPENHQSQEQVKPQNISSPGQHSRPPTVMSQPRKSRIAAKFKMDVE